VAKIGVHLRKLCRENKTGVPLFGPLCINKARNSMYAIARYMPSPVRLLTACAPL